METLQTIKNYIYGKGILSSINNSQRCIEGLRKGQKFKIYFMKSPGANKRGGKVQMVLEYKGKKLFPKNNIALGGMLK